MREIERSSVREGRQGLEMSGRNVTACAWEVASGVEATLSTPGSKPWSFCSSFFNSHTTLTSLCRFVVYLLARCDQGRRVTLHDLWVTDGDPFTCSLGSHWGGEVLPGSPWEQMGPRLWSFSHSVYSAPRTSPALPASPLSLMPFLRHTRTLTGSIPVGRRVCWY